MNKLDYVIVDLLESTARNIKAQPVNLGGIAGMGGGVGGPPGGFIGWLPQTRVAYDTDEAALSGITNSGTLLDNLNHIRYRIQNLEAGILTVEELDGSPSVDNVNRITISGAVITDLGSGHISLAINDIDGDATYLRLDTDNSPLTGPLEINVSNFGSYSPTPYGLEIIITDTGGTSGGLLIQNAGGSAGWLESRNDNQVLDLAQVGNVSANIDYAAFEIFRYGDGAAPTFNESAIYIYDFDSVANYNGGTLSHYDGNGDKIVGINPYASATNIMVVFNSVNDITTSGKLLLLQNQNVDRFSVDGDGNVNIPSGMAYEVDGVRVVSNRVVDSRIDDTINTGDATTDGIIDAIRDALIAHGLISAS